MSIKIENNPNAIYEKELEVAPFNKKDIIAVVNEGIQAGVIEGGASGPQVYVHYVAMKTTTPEGTWPLWVFTYEKNPYSTESDKAFATFKTNLFNDGLALAAFIIDDDSQHIRRVQAFDDDGSSDIYAIYTYFSESIYSSQNSFQEFYNPEVVDHVYTVEEFIKIFKDEILDW